MFYQALRRMCVRCCTLMHSFVCWGKLLVSSGAVGVEPWSKEDMLILYTPC